jgi:hypothetical protein
MHARLAALLLKRAPLAPAAKRLREPWRGQQYAELRIANEDQDGIDAEQ